VLPIRLSDTLLPCIGYCRTGFVPGSVSALPCLHLLIQSRQWSKERTADDRHSVHIRRDGAARASLQDDVDRFSHVFCHW
jgi:hypothetical protein